MDKGDQISFNVYSNLKILKKDNWFYITCEESPCFFLAGPDLDLLFKDVPILIRFLTGEKDEEHLLNTCQIWTDTDSGYCMSMPFAKNVDDNTLMPGEVLPFIAFKQTELRKVSKERWDHILKELKIPYDPEIIKEASEIKKGQPKDDNSTR